jgi:hypothetical protein
VVAGEAPVLSPRYNAKSNAPGVSAAIFYVLIEHIAHSRT